MSNTKQKIMFASVSLHIFQTYLGALTFMAIFLALSEIQSVFAYIFAILGLIAIDGNFSVGLIGAIKNWRKKPLQAAVVLFMGILSVFSSQIASKQLFSFKGVSDDQTKSIVKDLDVNANTNYTLAKEISLTRERLSSDYPRLVRAINTHGDKVYRKWMMHHYKFKDAKRVVSEFYPGLSTDSPYRIKCRKALARDVKEIRKKNAEIAASNRLLQKSEAQATDRIKAIASLASVLASNSEKIAKINMNASKQTISIISYGNYISFAAILLLGFYLVSLGAGEEELVKSFFTPFVLMYSFLAMVGVGSFELLLDRDFNGDGIKGFNFGKLFNKRKGNVKNRQKINNFQPNHTRERTYIKDKPNRHMNRENTLRQPTMGNATIGTIGIEEEDGGVLPSDLKSLLKGEFDERKIKAAIDNVSSASGLRSRHSVSKINYHKAQFHKNPNSNVFWNLAVAYKWYSITKKDNRLEKTKEWIIKYLDI